MDKAFTTAEKFAEAAQVLEQLYDAAFQHKTLMESLENIEHIIEKWAKYSEHLSSIYKEISKDSEGVSENLMLLQKQVDDFKKKLQQEFEAIKEELNKNVFNVYQIQFRELSQKTEKVVEDLSQNIQEEMNKLQESLQDNFKSFNDTLESKANSVANVKISRKLNWIFPLLFLQIIILGGIYLNPQLNFKMKQNVVTETPKIIYQRTFNLKILNGTSQNGLAGRLRMFLQKQNKSLFQNISVGNAPLSSYSSTVFQINSGVSTEFLRKFIRLLGSNRASIQFTDNLPPGIDMVIILGNDYKKLKPFIE